jgi:glutaminyl-tRNA synthetase
MFVPHNHLLLLIPQVPFSRIVYIEKTDFRLKDSKDYYGLAPGKSALLRYHFFIETADLVSPNIARLHHIYLVHVITRYAFPIKCTDVIYGDNPDDIVEIRAQYDPSKTSKPKVRFNGFSLNL